MPIYHCQSAIAQQLSFVTMCKRWLQVALLPGSSPAGEDVTQAGEESGELHSQKEAKFTGCSIFHAQ